MAMRAGWRFPLMGLGFRVQGSLFTSRGLETIQASWQVLGISGFGVVPSPTYLHSTF